MNRKFWIAISLFLMMPWIGYYLVELAREVIDNQIRMTQSPEGPRIDWVFFFSEMDWLLVVLYLIFTVLLAIRIDLKRDLFILIVGLFGGFILEAWGTQTLFWVYYTDERPPLWVIPGWALASLATDRMVYFAMKLRKPWRAYLTGYLLICFGFYISFLQFVGPRWKEPWVIFAFLLSAIALFLVKNREESFLTILLGMGLGIPIEIWGTTRECWIYYNGEMPPLFAIFGHGVACVGFLHLRNLLARVPVHRPLLKVLK